MDRSTLERQSVTVRLPASGLPDHDAAAARLENLRSLTDVSLTRLDVDEFLGELLARVCEILDSDTSAVLLLDGDSEELVARAACGIENEVRQGVRVPLGSGFAGRIAATKEPLRLDRVDSTTVSNPLLWEKGIQVMLGVPLLGEEAVIGVLHVGRLENRPFGEEDTVLLQVAADRIAGAIQTRALAIERAATLLLERSLLPPGCRCVPNSHSPLVTSLQKNTLSAVIGMTSSCFRRDSCGSLSAT